MHIPPNVVPHAITPAKSIKQNRNGQDFTSRTTT